MEKSEGTGAKEDKLQIPTLVLDKEETKRVSDFFSVLIQIDRRVNITKSYGKSLDK